jgi:hypothetical protein
MGVAPRTPRAVFAAILVGGAAWTAAGAGAAAAQTPFADLETEELFRSAQRAWRSVDESVVRYTALVQQRMAASLRTPLKDRTIFSAESAARIFWDRDYDQIEQILASSMEAPGPAEVTSDDFFVSSGFDPGGDRLIFGFGDWEADTEEDEFYIVHPLGSEAADAYRYEAGDTLVLTLPDARELRAVELRIIPIRSSPNYVTGTLWIEPESGALVRAAYRLARQLDVIRDIPDFAAEEEEGNFRFVPGFLKPWTFDLTLVTVDYTLWDFRVWLPRAMRLEGQVRAGVIKAPASFDIAYRMESVVTEEDLAAGALESPFGPIEEVEFETREEALAFIAERLSEDEGIEFEVVGDALVPVDREFLREGPYLPAPIWEDAPGFLSEDDLSELEGMLDGLPRPEVASLPFRSGWGLSRPETLRYNRVEALSAGVGTDGRIGSPFGPLDVEASALFGVADLQPKARLELTRASFSSTVSLAGYRDLQAVDHGERFLGLGNSLNAFLWGRDDGEYFLAWGGELRIAPPETDRPSWEFRAYGEQQRSVETNTDVALTRVFDSAWRFRPNVRSTELDEFGTELWLRPWWGRDPERPQGGIELYGQAARWRPEGGGAWSSYGRARATARLTVPISPRWRVGTELGAGTSFEIGGVGVGASADPAASPFPAQRQWFLGGPLTLRGYDASVLRGEDHARARLEVARGYRGGSLTLFGDAGWAGLREEFDEADVLYAVGVGVSLLDGLVRLDLSRGLTGDLARTRLDLYLDAIL